MVFSIWNGRRVPPANPTRFTALQQVRAYWEGLRRGGQLPLRAAVDPRGIAGVLDQGAGHLIVLEEPEADPTYVNNIALLKELDKVVDALYQKAAVLS